MNDSDSSSDDSIPEHTNFIKTKKNDHKDEEYIPTCPSGILQDVLNSYVPSGSPQYHPKSPTPPKSKPHHSPAVKSPTPVPKVEKKKAPPKRRNSMSVASMQKMDAKRVKHFVESMSPPPPPTPVTTSKAQTPPVSKSKSVSFIEIKNDTVLLTRLQKKNSFDINLQIPIKYYKNVMPIFNKGIRMDLFVQREKSDNLWTNVTVKNFDGTQMPIAIYKILNVDENIVNNLALSMNNRIKFKESTLNVKSDKNYKIYDESGIIRIGLAIDNDEDEDRTVQDKCLYANARIELKKNITYVFNLSLNVIFARNYVNVQSEFYKCSLNSREDNNYLTCLVITVLENYTIENGEKLMHHCE
ncbi:hypothetical protein [Drosophila suzukii associated hytrosavirus 1]|nr:hypothetical protein [Drosophila suzukii associated hytrosavirus 1]